MANFTDAAMLITQGSIGDTLSGREIHGGYGSGDYELVWISENRGIGLVKNINTIGVAYRFVEVNGYIVMDSFIGPDWTVGRILDAVSSDRSFARAAAIADAHR